MGPWCNSLLFIPLLQVLEYSLEPFLFGFQMHCLCFVLEPRAGGSHEQELRTSRRDARMMVSLGRIERLLHQVRVRDPSLGTTLSFYTEDPGRGKIETFLTAPHADLSR